MKKNRTFKVTYLVTDDGQPGGFLKESTMRLIISKTFAQESGLDIHDIRVTIIEQGKQCNYYIRR